MKEQASHGIVDVPIDAFAGSRYSQAQIKDLAAYANSGSHKIDKSSGSWSPCAPENLLKAVAASLSYRPPAPSALTADNLYKTFPGRPASGPARFISRLNRLPGGY